MCRISLLPGHDKAQIIRHGFCNSLVKYKPMKYLIPTILVIVILSSCAKPKSTPMGAGRTYTCEAFDPKMLDTWFPYQLRVTYKYVDSNNKTYRLTADSINYSSRYTSSDYMCVISGSVYALTNPTDSLDINMNIGYYLVHGPGMQGANLYFNWFDTDILFNRYYYKSDTLYPSNKSKKIFDKMVFSGNEYQTVHEIYANSHTVKYIYIAKGNGVVAFTTHDDNLYWLES